MTALNKIYRLLVINSLEKVGDRFNIKDLESGMIVSVFGMLFCAVGVFVFQMFPLFDSQIVAGLGFWAYLSIFVHHVVEYEKGKWPKKGRSMGSILIVAVSTIVMLLIYIVLIDRAFGIVRYFIGIRTLLGLGTVFVHVLPGLVVLAIPLFFWEPLSKLTPVDKIVKAVFR